MDFGKLEYVIKGPGGLDASVHRLRLTLVGHDDDEVLKREGVAVLRRMRIVRLTSEAFEQGAMLSYEELADLLMTSLATLKRDINVIEGGGQVIRLRRRRTNDNSRFGAESGDGG